MAAIVATNRAFGGGSGGSGSHTSGSITPTPGRMYILSVRGRTGGGGTPADPTITAFGLTWTLVKSSKSSASGAWVFRAVGTPTPGTLTITFAEAISTIAYSLEEFQNVDRTGTNGSNGIVQSKNLETGNASSMTITMDAAPSNAKNVTYGFLVERNTIKTLTPGSGQTALRNNGFDGDDSWLTQYKANSQVSDCTSSGESAWIGIALELKFKVDSGGFFKAAQ